MIDGLNPRGVIVILLVLLFISNAATYVMAYRADEHCKQRCREWVGKRVCP